MNPRHIVVPTYLALCLALGGASAAGYLSNLLLQLIAIAILVAASIARPQTTLPASASRLMVLLALMICLFAVQLVPLPPAIWTTLPGRQAIANGFGLLGWPLPWLSLSLAPLQTIAALIWLLPAFAVLFGIIRLGAYRPALLAWTIVIMTALSVAVGAIQVAGGERSAAYFYAITNAGLGVGFFANANHMATLLLVTIPFLAALQASALTRGRRSARRASGLIVLTAGMMLVVIVGLIINTSLAGVGLAVPTAAASFFLLRSREKALPLWALPAIGALAIAAVALVMSSPFGNNLTGEDARGTAGSRFTSFSRTIDGAQEFFPFGSGIGTFVDVYRTREDPAAVDRIFMNHAHSDVLELALETGVLGIALISLFLLWWVGRAVAIWRADEPDLFARAATIASAAIVAHSLVDYPLRTAAISAIFAACLALMAQPRPIASRVDAADRSTRHLSAS